MSYVIDANVLMCALKDISYLALAIQTNSVLLTRDQPIYKRPARMGFFGLCYLTAS